MLRAGGMDGVWPPSQSAAKSNQSQNKEERRERRRTTTREVDRDRDSCWMNVVRLWWMRFVLDSIFL
ncbi:hypothetical protein SDJN03_09975, partial [Cucurbita argyrosperma subsp. sororia]